MATVTKPIALDESLNTTEVPSRNVADVLAEELQNIAQAIGGSGGDSVSWTQIQSTGTKIAEIAINGTSTNVYAPNGGGGGGGHTIEGADGTALSQEPTLQFADADATDDAVNEKTVVNVVRKRTQAEYDAMSAADQAKGIIHITDANAKPLFASQVRYGDETVKDMLDMSADTLTYTNAITDVTLTLNSCIRYGRFYIVNFTLTNGSNAKVQGDTVSDLTVSNVSIGAVFGGGSTGSVNVVPRRFSDSRFNLKNVGTTLAPNDYFDISILIFANA